MDQLTGQLNQVKIRYRSSTGLSGLAHAVGLPYQESQSGMHLQIELRIIKSRMD